MPMGWKVWTLLKGGAIVCLQCEGHILVEEVGRILTCDGMELPFHV